MQTKTLLQHPIPHAMNQKTYGFFRDNPIAGRVGFWFWLSLWATGCAMGSKSLKSPTQEILMEPLHIGVKPDAELGLMDFDALTLFREGLRLQEEGNVERALLFYQRLIQEFPSSRYLSASAFNAGRCLEELKQWDKAIEHYRLITQQLPQSKDWVDAAFQESLSLVELSRHAEATELLRRLLDRQDLTTSDRIDALVLYGESLTNGGEAFEAEKTFRSALRLFREREREEYLDPVPAARAEFRLAELAEGRFITSPLRLPEEQMRQDLEAKAQILLEAQAGFLRCIRYGDPEWATAGSFRIANLYLQLHQAMEQAPIPEDLSPEEAQVYREMLRKRTGVLLRKALRVFEMTLEIAVRTGSENQWTQAAREQMTQIEKQVLSLYENDAPQGENPPETAPKTP